MHIVYAGLRQGQFSGARDFFRNSGRLLIILADNYNQTTNDLTTEAQSTQSTHRDFFGKGFGDVSSLPVLAVRGPAAPGSPLNVPHPCRGPRLALVAAVRGPGRLG